MLRPCERIGIGLGLCESGVIGDPPGGSLTGIEQNLAVDRRECIRGRDARQRWSPAAGGLIADTDSHLGHQRIAALCRLEDERMQEKARNTQPAHREDLVNHGDFAGVRENHQRAEEIRLKRMRTFGSGANTQQIEINAGTTRREGYIEDASGNRRVIRKRWVRRWRRSSRGKAPPKSSLRSGIRVNGE